MAEERTNAILRTLDNMPPLLPTAAKVFEIANDPHSSITDMDAVISIDTMLSAKVLKLVNSAYYGLRDKISTTQRAIVHLGMNTIKNLVITVAVMKSLTDTLRGSDIDLSEFWKHSLACSVAARLLAQKSSVGVHAVDDIALAGLLHDIGKLALVSYSSVEYQKVISLALEKNVSFFAAERQVITGDHKIIITVQDGVATPVTQDVQIDHCYIGKKLAAKWNLPSVLSDPIEWHHLPWRCMTENAKAAQIIHVADAYCKMKGMGFAGDVHVAPIQKPTWEILGFGEGELEKMESDWLKGIEDSQAFLEMDSPD